MKIVLLVIGLMFSLLYADTTLCSKGDTVVFSCDIKKKKLSVCKYNGSQFVYRYGTRNKVELEIMAKPRLSSEQFIRVNYEEHLRFHNKGYDYIVYSNELMEYEKDPYDGTARYVEHSGVYVVKNKNVLAKLTCNKICPYMKGIGNIGNSILKEKYIGY